jgi:hypothetical protein
MQGALGRLDVADVIHLAIFFNALPLVGMFDMN